MKTHVLTPNRFHVFLAKTAETYLGSVAFGSFALKLRVFRWFCSPPGLKLNKNSVKREGFGTCSPRLQDAPRYVALKLRVFTRFCSHPGLQLNKHIVKHKRFGTCSPRLQDAPRDVALKLRVFFLRDFVAMRTASLIWRK